MVTKRPLLGVTLAVAFAAAACDRAQLVAPTQSSITVTAATKLLPSNGDTEITASVIEQAGTPVQNGTTVRFTATLGRIDPVEAQTRNGVATTRFFANNTSGIAVITATSGAASGGESTANRVEITVGAAAVSAVTLRANPGSIGPQGGSTELIATVVGENGQPLPGIVVTFNADQGSLSAAAGTTGSNGEARTTLTTSVQTIVSATAGTKTSSNVTVALRAGPIVTIACAPAGSTSTSPGNCASLPANSSNNTASVLFTITRPTGSSTLRTATIDFGDGTSQNLGNLAGGTATITHAYAGPSGSTSAVYTATVQATDINGESQSASTTITVTPRAQLTVSIGATGGTATAGGQRWEFTATLIPTDAGAQSYTWDFGDGDEVTTSGNTTAHVYDTTSTEQRRTVTVTVRTVDSRTVSGRTEILVDNFP